MDELRIHTLNLIDMCPLCHDNPRGCPFYHKRVMHIHARGEWAMKAPLKDLQEMVDKHAVCSKWIEFNNLALNPEGTPLQYKEEVYNVSY